MAKQRLESDLSKTLKQKYPHYYSMKLHNNPMAHQTTPADFMVLSGSNNYLIECKQCSLDRFEFSRLTQKEDLLIFESKLSQNYSYALIMFYTGRLDRSQIYMIPIKDLIHYMDTHKLKSINKKVAVESWAEYSISLEKGGIFNLDNWI